MEKVPCVKKKEEESNLEAHRANRRFEFGVYNAAPKSRQSCCQAEVVAVIVFDKDRVVVKPP